MASTGRVALLALLVILGVGNTMAAATYFVGGSAGWTFQTSNNAFYNDEFTSQKVFVGDVLVFNYSSLVHNVYQIPVADLASCDFSNPIAKFLNSNAVVTLTTAGANAFACEVPTHCSQLGMHLQLNVLAAAPAPAPTTAPVPAPTKAPTPAPVTTAPAPAPKVATPVPAPAAKSPAPSPKSPKPVPVSSTPASGPGVSGPALAPGTNAASFVSSGTAMVVAAIVAGCAVVLL